MIKIVYAFIFANIAMAFVLSGCSNLQHKGVVVSGSVQGLKIVTTADPETGAAMPQIATGFGEFMFADCPVDGDAYFEYFHQEKSLWSNVAASTKYIRVSGGKGCDTKPAVIMLMEPLKEQPLSPGK